MKRILTKKKRVAKQVAFKVKSQKIKVCTKQDLYWEQLIYGFKKFGKPGPEWD